MKDLPHKTEFVLVIKTTPLQRRLYKAFIERRRKEVARLRLLRRPHAHCSRSLTLHSIRSRILAAVASARWTDHAPHVHARAQTHRPSPPHAQAVLGSASAACTPEPSAPAEPRRRLMPSSTVSTHS